MSYRAGAWLIDEWHIAFILWKQIQLCGPNILSLSYGHLSYRQRFVWYLGYNGYQFFEDLVGVYVGKLLESNKAQVVVEVEAGVEFGNDLKCNKSWEEQECMKYN